LPPTSQITSTPNHERKTLANRSPPHSTLHFFFLCPSPPPPPGLVFWGVLRQPPQGSRLRAKAFRPQGGQGLILSELFTSRISSAHSLTRDRRYAQTRAARPAADDCKAKTG